jgi:hypothetical protein
MVVTDSLADLTPDQVEERYRFGYITDKDAVIEYFFSCMDQIDDRVNDKENLAEIAKREAEEAVAKIVPEVSRIMSEIEFSMKEILGRLPGLKFDLGHLKEIVGED